MSTKPNFYDILSLEKTANESQIKKAYRKLAMKHHPDKGGDPEKFKKVSEAYEILSDPNKRKQYDQFGTYDSQEMPDFDDIFQSFFNQNPMEDLFGGFFGGPSPFFQKREQKEIKVDISLEEAFCGKTVKYRHYQKVFQSGEVCTQCDGKGTVIHRIQLAPGMFSQSISNCPVCKGKKSKGESKLLQKKEVILNIDIPRGAPCGMQLRLEGKGDIVDDGDPQDILVTFVHKKHKKYKCSSQNPTDLIYTHHISLHEIINGFSVHVQMLDGTVISFLKKIGLKEIDRPIVYRIEGRGLRYGDKIGDLLLYFKVDIPPSIHEIYPTRIQPLQQSSSSIVSLDNLPLETFEL